MLLNTAEPADEYTRAESVLAKLGDDTGAPAPSAEPTAAPETPESSGAPEAPEAAPVEGQPSGKDAPTPEPAPQEPPIEAPASWSKEKKEVFRSLPRAAQEIVAERERERDVELRRGQNEAADHRRQAEDARKAAEAERAQIAQNQQRYAQALATLTQQIETVDPVIATYQRLQKSGELVKLAKENPSQYAELDAAYKSRTETLQALRREQETVQRQAQTDHFMREEQALVTAIPEWKAQEVGQKAISDLREHAVKAYGFKPQEVSVITDHRFVLMARDAAAYHALKAEVEAEKAKTAAATQAAQAAIAAKKVVTTGKTVLPNPSAEQHAQQTDRNKALINKAKGTRSLADKAALIAETL